MARRRTVPVVPCLEHPGSDVVAFGVRETAAGRSQRYRCTPVVGDPHVFHVPVEADVAVAALARLAPAPECGPRLDALGRCGPRDRCPACRRGEPCPLDNWPVTVGPAALGDPNANARGFFQTTGRKAGTGVYTQWRATGLSRLADEALLACASHWRRRSGQAARASQLFQLAWAAGSRHPDVADAYAGALAATGREENLRTALAVAKLAARQRGGCTHEGWRRLQARSHQIGGRLRRLAGRPSGQFDADGNPVLLRRHHPTTPRRTRTHRFIR